jgi:hypothetical protein
MLMYSDMFYIQWHHLVKMIYGINKYMNIKEMVNNSSNEVADSVLSDLFPANKQSMTKQWMYCSFFWLG